MLHDRVNHLQTFAAKMENRISEADLLELQSLLEPLENRMPTIIRDYILGCRSLAAVSHPGIDTRDIESSNFDMACMLDVLLWMDRVL